MKVKYNRTSTMSQEGNRFSLDTEKYDLTIFDKGVSGVVPFKERPMVKNKLLPLLEKNEVTEVWVEELSRLGRNTVDSINTLKFLEDLGVTVVVKNLGNLKSIIDGNKNPMWNLITSVMSSIYEMEKTNILERTAAGREVYRMRGGKLGRKNGTQESRNIFLEKDKTKEIISLLKCGKSVRDISGRLSVSSATVCKVKKYIG
jgi:DNA invertase Pin-like site-specific DNA recombinase